MESSGDKQSCKLSKCKMSMDVYSADRISELPDEVLENILSRLTLREAVATSLISRRWKNLWTYSTGSFDFDFGSAVLATIKQTRAFRSFRTERARYIETVDNILSSHKGLTIDALKITFDLRKSSAKHVNAWIEFAMRKRVQSLELDLTHINPKDRQLYVDEIMKCYTFPSLETFNFSRLTSLKLNLVNMSRESAEHILSNCPVLEKVIIINSPSLSGVRVANTCPRLKYLEVADCQSMEFLDISFAPSLTSLSFTASRNKMLCIGEAPNLVHVSLQGGYCSRLIQNFHDVRLPLSQIQKLKLVPNKDLSPTFNKFPELTSVTDLELEFEAVDERSLLSCGYVIEACPNLRSLYVQLSWVWEPERGVVKRRRPEPEFEEGRSYKCLKEVELSGFRGGQTDIELAKHILSTSPYLEKITVNTIHRDYVIGTSCSNLGENDHAQKFARHIASRYSPAALLIVR